MFTPKNWFRKLKRALYKEPETKEQLTKVLRNATRRSLIDSATLGMIEGVMQFSQMKARDIMLPKNQMTNIPADTSLQKAIRIVSESGHSRFPIIAENNGVLGVLHAKDLIRFQFQHEHDESFDPIDIARQVSFVPESKRLDSLLAEFKKYRNHMAIVVDEYGAVAGFVTLEDIIEQIIGDIEDEFDIDEEAYIKIHDDDKYIVKAHTPIEDFNHQLNTNFSDEFYDTLGGIVMEHFGGMPKRGDIINFNNFEFKILNADARRIKLIECTDLRKNTPLSGDPLNEL